MKRIIIWLLFAAALILIFWEDVPMIKNFTNTNSIGGSIEKTELPLPLGLELILLSVTFSLGVSLVLLVFLLIFVPLRKNLFLNDPDKPNKFAFLVEIGENRMVYVAQQGVALYKIDGNVDRPIQSDALLGLWMWYKNYIWRLFKLHVYPPYFRQIHRYELHPRYEPKVIDGKITLVPLPEGRFSNHVRTKAFTWHFKLSGVDIQGIPFVIEGSMQIRIDENKIYEIFYVIESWSQLLYEALSSVSREVCQKHATVDKVIGTVAEELWKDTPQSDPKEAVSKRILKELLEFNLNENKEILNATSKTETRDKRFLSDFGILILSLNITDFRLDPKEISPELVEKIFSPLIKRQLARAAALEGKGTAEAAQAMANVLEGIPPEIADSINRNKAWIEVAKESGGSIETALQAWVKNSIK